MFGPKISPGPFSKEGNRKAGVFSNGGLEIFSLSFPSLQPSPFEKFEKGGARGI
jgi:hypothetical protein